MILPPSTWHLASSVENPQHPLDPLRVSQKGEFSEKRQFSPRVGGGGFGSRTNSLSASTAGFFLPRTAAVKTIDTFRPFHTRHTQNTDQRKERVRKLFFSVFCVKASVTCDAHVAFSLQVNAQMRLVLKLIISGAYLFRCRRLESRVSGFGFAHAWCTARACAVDPRVTDRASWSCDPATPRPSVQCWSCSPADQSEQRTVHESGKTLRVHGQWTNDTMRPQCFRQIRLAALKQLTESWWGGFQLGWLWRKSLRAVLAQIISRD